MKIYTKIRKLIEKYDTIAVFRHVMPDYDALGSQFGLVTFLKDNYPNKKIYALGQNHTSFTGKLFPECDVVSDEELLSKPFLAIVLDVGNSGRIEDSRFMKAAYNIKIDHHPTEDDYANLNLVLTSYCATSEILTEMVFSSSFKNTFVTPMAAKYLYTALVGDSGRFLYDSVTTRTFVLASKLVNTGINFAKEIYAPMYNKKLSDLKITGYLLSKFQVTDKGVGYYHFTNEEMERFGINLEKSKEYVGLLANIEEIKIWVSCYEDIAKNVYRVSIRSRDYTVNQVASRFAGGGHAKASGATCKNYEETLELIKALDELI